ncbi:aminodeoxychorismate/anthranilate synthase component II [Mycolicibacterium bacteremicum]|uniref:anthranilate synthase component II n=1 Tax=Mycolicibacterium bacteremicum TaxID=564198 RepID=UPI0026F0F317|nr:aminodeoxychorismate/anthranilate synthase component II [Mycolicibacterium bacteremicum]
MKTLILDNYDSFTFNLFQYVGGVAAPPVVWRNDAVTIEDVIAQHFDRIIISPGPGNPDDPRYFGVCRAVILELGHQIPILGVCLGHQGIISAFGGTIRRAAMPMHGKTSQIRHDGKGVFAGIAPSVEVMRYHSLVGERSTLPDCLEPAAATSDGELMAVRHRSLPIHGVQFHPESIGTTIGKALLRNFMSPQCSAPMPSLA